MVDIRDSFNSTKEASIPNFINQRSNSSSPYFPNQKEKAVRLSPIISGRGSRVVMVPNLEPVLSRRGFEFGVTKDLCVERGMHVKSSASLSLLVGVAGKKGEQDSS
ncbi:hypothetical protein TNCV_1218401 [Trichonephila clavipes]|nr:hypothetical protein TNCV_1218401 [Trichonephila clavipes]